MKPGTTKKFFLNTDNECKPNAMLSFGLCQGTGSKRTGPSTVFREANVFKLCYFLRFGCGFFGVLCDEAFSSMAAAADSRVNRQRQPACDSSASMHAYPVSSSVLCASSFSPNLCAANGLEVALQVRDRDRAEAEGHGSNKKHMKRAVFVPEVNKCDVGLA